MKLKLTLVIKKGSGSRNILKYSLNLFRPARIRDVFKREYKRFIGK